MQLVIRIELLGTANEWVTPVSLGIQIVSSGDFMYSGVISDAVDRV